MKFQYFQRTLSFSKSSEKCTALSQSHTGNCTVFQHDTKKSWCGGVINQTILDVGTTNKYHVVSFIHWNKTEHFEKRRHYAQHCAAVPRPSARKVWVTKWWDPKYRKVLMPLLQRLPLLSAARFMSSAKRKTAGLIIIGDEILKGQVLFIYSLLRLSQDISLKGKFELSFSYWLPWKYCFGFWGEGVWENVMSTRL